MRISVTAAGDVRSSVPVFTPTPKYSGINPARSRIQIITQPSTKTYGFRYSPVSILPAECMGRDKYIIDGKGIRRVRLLQGRLSFQRPV